MCLCVCVCSPLGFPVTGLRDVGWSNAREACDELLLLCCPYVRDLRNCCYCFAETWAWYLTCYCKLKKKMLWHARKRENNPSETKPKPNLAKKERKIARKHLQTKWKLIIRSWCCVCVTVNYIPFLWIIRWYNEWLFETILEKMVCMCCMQARVCAVRVCVRLCVSICALRVSGPGLEC